MTELDKKHKYLRDRKRISSRTLLGKHEEMQEVIYFQTLKMIQMAINRFSSNSFLLKVWSVVLVSALFALAVYGANTLFVYLAFFPAIAFWLLDAYYLWQERLFRKLYDDVRQSDKNEPNFSMHTRRFRDQTSDWALTILSKPLIVFHGIIILIIIIVTLFSIL